MVLALPLLAPVLWFGTTLGMNLGTSLGMSPVPSALVGVLGAMLTVLAIGGA